METKNQLVASALVIGIALIAAALVGAYAFVSVRALDNTISVTGSAKTAVMSDVVKWHLGIARRTNDTDMKGGYALLGKDVQTTRTFLLGQHITGEEITISPIFVEEIYKSPGEAGPREFTLRQELTVQSKNVSAIDALSKNMDALIASGVFIGSNNVEYFISTLPELRVKLLGDAIRDAKARAEEIAKASGTKVGTLKSSSSGVVQVLAPNSIDVSDYGQYDVQSIAKEAMVTVRATFFVQ